MNTIFWLAIFGTIYGYVRFFGSMYGSYSILKGKSGTRLEQAIVLKLYNEDKLADCWRWREFFFAIICTIIACTI